MAIHTHLTGTGPGRRRDVEVLNKASILFACASFEAFVEHLAAEAFAHIVSQASDPSKIPKPVLKAIAASLKEDKNELKVWEMAGEGWRAVCENYRQHIVAKHTGPFNTPKPHNVEALLRELIGLRDLPARWRWRGMTASKSSANLREFVELRGALAHGESPAPTVRKRDVERWIKFLAPLSVRCANEVRTYCHSVTGKHPWTNAVYGTVT